MSSLDKFNYVILDLGGVVLNLDYSQTVKSFKTIIPELDESTFFGKEKQLDFFSEYEVGRSSTSEFIQKFKSYYNIEVSNEDFKNHWNAMIFDIPIERIDLLKRLRGNGKKVFLLSNINDLHATAVETSFSAHKLKDSFSSLFDNVYYSHVVGKRKPNKDIFELVIKENSIPKNDALFIDDSEHHVVGARACGIEAYHLGKGHDLLELAGQN